MFILPNSTFMGLLEEIKTSLFNEKISFLANAPTIRILLVVVIEERSRFMMNHKSTEAPKNYIGIIALLYIFYKFTKRSFKTT
ncbi:hypothetical protein CN386_03005 [Bacillus cereus]|nr:hypothetical protein MLA2C4_19690 [Bacillus mobilis]PEU85059.1 hypothetical protein CN386_03005 [Bacillus cereus]BCD30766.1 hypothetical protein BC30102_3802 [Bacillus cereus]